MCVTLGVTGILLDCFYSSIFSRGRRCKGLRLTKLPCIWEARSDQPGVPAFETVAKAVATANELGRHTSLADMSARCHLGRPGIVVSGFALLASLPFEDPQAPVGVFT